ncbi:MAG: CPBP family intramembrane metalloprotease [Caldilineaceae bacterium]|nr:CPBP family intramembrane metalloprotease [Caldilineaceae bacterium]
MSDPLSMILFFLPLMVILWLANKADAERLAGLGGAGWARITYGIVALLFGLVLLLGLLLLTIPALDQAGLLSLSDLYQRLDTDSTLMQQIVLALPAIGGGVAGASFVALLLLLPAVRRGLARIIPIDPTRTVHAVSLSFTMLIVINMVVILAIGLDTLTQLVITQAAETAEIAVSPAMLLGLWTQQILMAIWAVIGVGWLARRSFAGSLERLAIRLPRGREVLMGMGGGFLAVFTSMFVAGMASFFGYGVDPDVQSLNEALLGPIFRSLPGILTIGFAAALGEETLFRGALQPRFGILITTLLFAITHNQYGLSLSTVVVFFAGLIFALLRRRFNTSTAMIAHATYNTSLGLLALLALEILERVEL